jgi:hypothetical protein
MGVPLTGLVFRALELQVPADGIPVSCAVGPDYIPLAAVNRAAQEGSWWRPCVRGQAMIENKGTAR